MLPYGDYGAVPAPPAELFSLAAPDSFFQVDPLSMLGSCGPVSVFPGIIGGENPLNDVCKPAEESEEFLANALSAEISTVEEQQHVHDTLATPTRNIQDVSSIDAHTTADEVAGQFTQRYDEDFRQLLEREPGLFSVNNVARAKESASDLFGVSSQAICRRLCLMRRF